MIVIEARDKIPLDDKHSSVIYDDYMYQDAYVVKHEELILISGF